MSTLFDNTSLPLWLWIVIIVVGSLCIIGGAVVIVVCMIRRRSTGSSVADQPTRRVTVRRGRVVPASYYLSLTGSKFGVGAFEEEARTTRSKSPFEWWGTLKEKTRSQYLEDGQVDTMLGGNTQARDIYARRDGARSTSSLDNQEKSPTADFYEVEPIEPAPTLSRPARHTSFSRPFQLPVYQEHDTDSLRDSQRHNRNLSVIKEASPQASMIPSRSVERRSSRLSAYNPGEVSRRERRPSDHGSDRQRPSQSDSRRPSDSSQGNCRRTSEGRRPSDHSSRHPSDRSSRSNRSSRSQHKQPRPLQQQHIDSGTSLPYYPPQEEVPRPIAYRGSRHSLGEHEMSNANASTGSLSKRSSLVSRHDSLTEHTELTRRPSRPKSLVLDDAVEYQQHQGPEYWAGRAEMMPPDLPTQPTTPTTPPHPMSMNSRTPSIGRSSGQQGKVLRKKSLKRQEVVSYVGT